MNKKITIFAVSLALISALSGCGANNSADSKSSSVSETSATESQTKGSEETIESKTTEKVTEAITTEKAAENSTDESSEVQNADVNDNSSNTSDSSKAESESEINQNSGAEKFLGTWWCDRVSLNISDNGDGTYQGKVSWADSAFANTEWTYTLKYDANSNSMVCDGNAKEIYYEYEEENKDPKTTIIYTDGSGIFTEKDNVITWNDAKENKGEGMKFVK